jgi:hypothetical protein
MMTDFAPPGGLQSWAASFWAGVLMRTPPSGGLTGSSVLSGACPYRGRGVGVGVPGADVASAGRSSSIDGVPVTQRDSLAAFGEGACTPPL